MQAEFENPECVVRVQTWWSGTLGVTWLRQPIRWQLPCWRKIVRRIFFILRTDPGHWKWQHQTNVERKHACQICCWEKTWHRDTFCEHLSESTADWYICSWCTTQENDTQVHGRFSNSNSIATERASHFPRSMWVCQHKMDKREQRNIQAGQIGFFHGNNTKQAEILKKQANATEKLFRNQPGVKTLFSSFLEHKDLWMLSEMAHSEESHRLLTVSNNTADAESSEEHSEVKRNWQENLKGIVAASLSVVTLILGVTSVQLLERRVPDLELQVFRCVAIVGFCLVWMLFCSSSLKVPVSEIGATLLYSLVITLDSTTIYMAYSLIPGSAAQCSISAGSILSGLLIFWLCKQETFSPMKVALSLLCLGGVVLVIQPWHRYTHLIHNLNMTTNCQMLDGTLKELIAVQQDRNFSNPCKSEKVEYHYRAENLSDKNISIANNNTALCQSLSPCFLEVVNNNDTLPANRTEAAKEEFLLFMLPLKWMDILGFTIAAVAGLIDTLLFLILKRYPCLCKQRFRSFFWAFSVVLVLSTILTFSVEEPVAVESLFDIAAVSVHCITSVATWFLWIYAIQHTSGTVVIIILSTCTVWLLIPQYTILSSILPGHRNWMEVVGVSWFSLDQFQGLWRKCCTQHKYKTKQIETVVNGCVVKKWICRKQRWSTLQKLFTCAMVTVFR